MGSYKDMRETLSRLDEVDKDKLRRDIDKGIGLLNESTALIEAYLARLRSNPTNHQRRLYLTQGGRA